MKTQAELNEIEIDIDYYDNESIVRAFLMYSALNRMKEFDFDEAFQYLRTPIEYKLYEHGQCEYEDFKNNMDELITGCHGDKVFEPFCVSTNYIYIDEDDVKEAILTMHYEKSKNAFDGMFDHLLEIIEEIDNERTEQQNVELFDRVIHAQHETGDIFDDIDIDYIKSDLDEELIELMGIEIAA